MKLSRRVMRTDKGERLKEGSYILTVSKTGRGAIIELEADELKTLTIDGLGAKA